MIKQFSTLLLLSAIALFACNKDDKKLPDEGEDFSEIFIDSVADMSVRRRSSDTLHLHISAAGKAYNTSLSIAGLPTGVTGSFSPVSATPPFTSILTITADSAAMVESSAQATITASANSSFKTERSLKVAVLPSVDDCASELAGTWNVMSSGTNGNSSGVTTITLDSVMPLTRIRIANFGGLNYTAYAMLDCTTRSVYIPDQTLGNIYHVLGGGYFTNDSMTINCNLRFDGGPTSGGFISRLQRQ